jgi:GT2 family glycosyltransferase
MNVDLPTVSIAIVTFNSARYIRRCLEAVLAQDGVSLRVVVADNASTDGTHAILSEFQGRIQVILCPRNVGFAAGQNRAIEASAGADWVLTLNPDVLMQPGFVRHLLDAGSADPTVGAVCGKLFSIAPGFEPLAEPRIDSAGIYFTPNMRHFDRGWYERDSRRYDCGEYVFGASAAAALYRREMIDDIAVDGDFFDPDFFVYREDADVAWRAQLMGWRCLYAPEAVAHHVRTVTPANRRTLPGFINMHSVKNRFLMRIKNVTPGLYRRYWLPMTLRDLVVMGGSIFWEPSSLRAFWRVAKCLPRAVKQRRQIMARRRVSDEELVDLFAAPAATPQPVLAMRRAAPSLEAQK